MTLLNWLDHPKEAAALANEPQELAQNAGPLDFVLHAIDNLLSTDRPVATGLLEIQRETGGRS
ncbi:MAG: hypothetical protein U0903_01680 [Planctomycetales bacterium]